MKIENKVVVGATASADTVTIYCEDGEVINIPSNTKFASDVIAAITPALANNDKILIDMAEKRLDIFEKVEKQTNGLVKFFRVAKKALGMHSETDLTEEIIRSIALPIEDYKLNDPNETLVAVVETAAPEVHEPETKESIEPAKESKPSANAEVGGSVLQAAKPATDASIATPRSADSDTKKAVSPVKNKPTIISGAEKLANQVKHFSETNNPEGFTKFMQHCAEVISTGTRNHTINELLDFLSKADLPIADDGYIVAYKRLMSNGDHFVDSHTRKVKQKVGSRVFMKDSMVDHNRHNQCSNGLHIGRRDYMNSFSGNVIIICKIHPKDVIAVPQDYSGAKMRCAGYNIVAQISQEAFAKIRSYRPITDDPETAKLLTNIIRGDHTPIIQTVEITGNNGSGLIITDLTVETPAAQTEPEKEVEIAPTAALDQVNTLSERQNVDPEKNSPKKIKEAAQKATKAAPAKEVMTAEQKKAKKLWKKFESGEMTKVAIAKQCKTSSRTLDRWAEKFKF